MDGVQVFGLKLVRNRLRMEIHAETIEGVWVKVGDAQLPAYPDQAAQVVPVQEVKKVGSEAIRQAMVWHARQQRAQLAERLDDWARHGLEEEDKKADLRLASLLLLADATALGAKGSS